MKLLNDKWNDRSSGILMMIIMFVAAAIVGNLGVILGMDIGQLALATAAFLVPVAGGQIGQALQGKPPRPAQPSPSSTDEPVPPAGVLDDETGKLDLGRILKIAAIIVALELAILVMVLRKDAGMIGVAELASAFIGYATASEITQKVGRI